MPIRHEKSRSRPPLLRNDDEEFEIELIETLAEAGIIFPQTDLNMRLFFEKNHVEVSTAETSIPSVDEILTRGRSRQSHQLVSDFFRNVFLSENESPEFVALARAARNLSCSVPDEISKKMEDDKRRSRDEC